MVQAIMQQNLRNGDHYVVDWGTFDECLAIHAIKRGPKVGHNWYFLPKSWTVL
jgi:hypothetical protein